MRSAVVTALLLASACGAPIKPTPDAGPDTRCGLDCEAQGRYGLIVDRCFEYSTDPGAAQGLPALGLWVRPVFTLEGGTMVLPVEYRVGGQKKMTDNFGIKNGELLLMRREFAASNQSVTYKDAASVINGVKWLAKDSRAGETYSSDSQAYLVNASGVGSTEATTLQVTTAEATASDQKTPLKTYADAVKLIFGELPPHGSDPRRVWVPDVGFTVIASSFSLTGASPTPVYLQAIRDLGTADGGTANCSLGGP